MIIFDVERETKETKINVNNNNENAKKIIKLL